MKSDLTLSEAFQQRFRGIPAIIRAPGRVNIIGEHTDYNEGFVLPAATTLCCWCAASKRTDRKLVIYSENFDACAEADLGNLRPSHQWSDYPLGVAGEMEKAGQLAHGANLYIRGEVPLGSGLSSSAAIEVATAYSLLGVHGRDLPPKAVALLCQRAENQFVGTNCGIMDQFTSCLGHAGNALFMDCRSLKYELVPFPSRIRLVVCNTMVKHELSVGEYNLRRRQCEEGVALLAPVLPGIRALRDVSMCDLENYRDRLPALIYRRCRHVVSENERVRKMVGALRSGNTGEMAELMSASHASLRDDFEVSCPELDLMVELALRQEGIHGARMMGGGFGGCTVNLVGAEHCAALQENIAKRYMSATGLRPDIYVCEPADGAGPAH